MSSALLLIWLGLAQAQILDVTRFDTMAECEAARSALIRQSERFDSPWVRCIEVEVPEAAR